MLFLGGDSHGKDIGTDGQDIFRCAKNYPPISVVPLSDKIPEATAFETELYFKEIIVDGGSDRFVYRHESIDCDEMLELYKNRYRQ